MAQKVRTVVDYFDDLTGEPIPDFDNDGQTFTFAFDGFVYQMDVSNASAEKVREMMLPLLEASAKVGKAARILTAGQPRKQTAAAAPTPAHWEGWLTTKPEEMSQKMWDRKRSAQGKEIREWARGNGFPEQGDKGRIMDGVREAWNEAHPDRIAPAENSWS